ncbi:MAG: hypothetical protein IJI14_19460 [Anaerolineaceae bacterium]|nr:hypothetical protein [Anaerolineaceae bacterium]
MNKKVLIPAIAMISVLVMFILNYAAPNFPGWLAVFAGGIAIVIVTLVDKNNNDQNQ